jgi:hypothetical protein
VELSEYLPPPGLVQEKTRCIDPADLARQRCRACLRPVRQSRARARPRAQLGDVNHLVVQTDDLATIADLATGYHRRAAYPADPDAGRAVRGTAAEISGRR